MKTLTFSLILLTASCSTTRDVWQHESQVSEAQFTADSADCMRQGERYGFSARQNRNSHFPSGPEVIVNEQDYKRCMEKKGYEQGTMEETFSDSDEEALAAVGVAGCVVGSLVSLSLCHYFYTK